MGRYVITGGRQRKKGADWELRRCDAALLVELDISDLSVSLVKTYVSPSEVRASHESTVVFKAGQANRDALLLCTTTEVLECATDETFVVRRRVSHPYLNDVHHVIEDRERDGVLIASTGLDSVIALDWSGELSTAWYLGDGAMWERFESDRDYRRVESTKPHDVHPNYLFYAADSLYVNFCHQRKCMPITGSGPEFDYSPLGAVGHDGVLDRGRVLVTTVNGKVAEFEEASGRLLRQLDLNTIHGGGQPLGWCRAIEPLDAARWIVGFSRLRPTRWHRNVNWVRRSITGGGRIPALPTRVACFNHRKASLEWEIDLEPLGMGEVFSILRLP